MSRKQLVDISTGLEAELGLPEFIVTDKEEKGDNILYTVSAKERPVCWNCGFNALTIHATNTINVKDLSRFGQCVGLRVEKRRYRCPQCKAVTPDTLTSIKGQMTVRLREKIKTETLYQPFTKLSAQYKCSAANIEKLFQEKKEECSEKYHPMMPASLVIDQMQIHDKKTAYTLLIDLDDKTARTIELTDSTTIRATEECLSHISDAARCRRVFLALHEEYRVAVRNRFGSQPIVVVVDKPHVIQALYAVFNEIRNKIGKSVGKNKSRAFAVNQILLSTDYEKLNQNQREHLQSLLDEHPMFKSAYDLKEAFLNIYGAGNAESAKAYYREWKEACLAEGVSGYEPLIRLIDSWHDEIFAYFDNNDADDKISSAKSEILQVDRDGYRYTFDVLRAKIIYRNLVENPSASVVDFNQFQ